MGPTARYECGFSIVSLRMSRQYWAIWRGPSLRTWVFFLSVEKTILGDGRNLIRWFVRGVIRGGGGRREFCFVEDADQPAAVLLAHCGDHEAFAGWAFEAVSRLRSGDCGVGIDGRRLRREKTDASHDVGAIGGFEIALEQVGKPLFDFRASVAVDSPHVREIRVFGEGHRRGVGVMVAETFIEIGEGLPDRRGVGVSCL